MNSFFDSLVVLLPSVFSVVTVLISRTIVLNISQLLGQQLVLEPRTCIGVADYFKAFAAYTAPFVIAFNIVAIQVSIHPVGYAATLLVVFFWIVATSSMIRNLGRAAKVQNTADRSRRLVKVRSEIRLRELIFGFASIGTAYIVVLSNL